MVVTAAVMVAAAMAVAATEVEGMELEGEGGEVMAMGVVVEEEHRVEVGAVGADQQAHREETLEVGQAAVAVTAEVAWVVGTGVAMLEAAKVVAMEVVAMAMDVMVVGREEVMAAVAAADEETAVVMGVVMAVAN